LNGTPKSPDYFLEKLIKNKSEDFEKIKLSESAVEEITTIIDKETNSLQSKLAEAFNNFPIPPGLLPRSQTWINNLRQSSRENLYIYNYAPKVLIYSKYNGEFVVIG
jgi:hypothetical protein